MDAHDYTCAQQKNRKGNYHTGRRFSTWRTASIMCLTKFYFLVRSIPAVINGFNSYLLAPVQSLWEPSKNIFPFYRPDHLVSSSTTQLGNSGPVCVFLLSAQGYWVMGQEPLKGNPAGKMGRKVKLTPKLLPNMFIFKNVNKLSQFPF